MYYDVEYLCEECASVFRWEFMLSAHLRHVHRVAYESSKIPNLTFETKKVLKAYMAKDIDCQTLDFLEIFAKKFNLNKESVYRHAKTLCVDV